MTAYEDRGHSRAEVLRRAAGLAVGLAAAGSGLVRLLGEALGRAAVETGPSLVSRDELLPGGRVPLGAERTLPPRRAPRFTLLGLHWQGRGTVWFRTRREGAAWSAWSRAVVHELPDPGREGVAGWHLGTPVWTGPADEIQYRLEGAVRRLRAHFVRSEPRSLRRPASAAQPLVIPRASWGADESIVRAEPGYASRLVLAVVHHTAGKSPATPEESAAIVRGIQVYHVKSNGWNDIGYNFLLDPFGQVFEGRRGGIERNVVGAHAAGFNTGSVGVAVLGNFEKQEMTPEAGAALAALLAWRLDVAHVDPLSRVAFPSGDHVHDLPAVAGHRDVNATACPGRQLYALLPDTAAAAAALGLPKLYEPAAEVTAKGNVAFRARLSEPRPWSVAVADAKGLQVARGEGAGPLVQWTWQAGQAPRGSYRYTIEAGPEVRPASGWVTLGGGTPPPDEEIPPRPPRPAGVPRRIPRWAFELRLWHLTPRAARGPRPASAPRPLPAWYWPWFRWQQEVARWKEQYGS